MTAQNYGVNTVWLTVMLSYHFTYLRYAFSVAVLLWHLMSSSNGTALSLKMCLYSLWTMSFTWVAILHHLLALVLE